MNQELHTASLHNMLARFQDGYAPALDELIRRTGERLEHLAHKMLRDYSAVRAHEQTGDVLQNALIRLTRSLREVQPPSTADFFRLAAEQIRRELIDLARFHRRRAGVSQPAPSPDVPSATPPPFDPPDHNVADAADLDRWQALHEAVAQLSPALRDVFALRFYQDWTQCEIAELLGVSDRQVRRWWREACLRLNEILGDDLPA